MIINFVGRRNSGRVSVDTPAAPQSETKQWIHADNRCTQYNQHRDNDLVCSTNFRNSILFFKSAIIMQHRRLSANRLVYNIPSEDLGHHHHLGHDRQRNHLYDLEYYEPRVRGTSMQLHGNPTDRQ